MGGAVLKQVSFANYLSRPGICERDHGCIRCQIQEGNSSGPRNVVRRCAALPSTLHRHESRENLRKMPERGGAERQWLRSEGAGFEEHQETRRPSWLLIGKTGCEVNSSDKFKGRRVSQMNRAPSGKPDC